MVQYPGDDCVSIVNASSAIKMKTIYCGPGHGIRYHLDLILPNYGFAVPLSQKDFAKMEDCVCTLVCTTVTELL